MATASIVSIIFSKAGGKHKEAEVPRQLKRKITFLRRCFRQIDALAPMRDEALALFDEIDRLKVFREGVAHGYPDAYNTETHTYRFTKLEIYNEPEVRTHTPIHLTLSIGDLTAAARDSITLITSIVKFFQRIRQTWMPENEGDNGGGGVRT